MSPPPPSSQIKADTQRRSTLIKLGLAVIGATLAIAGGFFAGQSRNQAPASNHGVTVLDDPRPIPPFRLHGASGDVDNGRLLGRWTYIFFGYTHCPDVCPTALSLMKDVKAHLADLGVAPPQVLFVSVDPKRDTVELLSQYVPAFDPSFAGITGDDAALAPLVKHFGVYVKRHEDESPLNYTVDHSAGIYLVDPRGHLKALYMPPHDAQFMASHLASLSKR